MNELNKVTVYGKNSVITILKFNTRKVWRVYLSHEKDKDTIPEKYKKLVEINKKKFSTKREIAHQGFAVLVDRIKNYKLIEIDENEKNICVLDKIYDKRNLGSIIRTLAAFKINSLIINKRDYDQSNISMLKTSSGAIEFIKIYPVSNINTALNVLKEKKFNVFGFDSSAEQSIYYNNIYTQKNAFIFGSENEGLRELTKKNCDKILKIPIEKRVESLNISNAIAAFFGYYSSII